MSPSRSPPTTPPPSASPTAGFTYPFYTDRWETTLFIGTLLVLTSITVFPAIILLGYCWRLAAHATTNRDPPTFTNWLSLLTAGLSGILTAGVLVIGVTLFIGGPLFVTRSLLTGYQPTTLTPMSALLSAGAVSLITGVCWAYLLPASFVSAAAAGRVRSGFSFHVLSTLLSIRYCILWTLTITAVIGMTITSLLLTLLPVVGAILSALTTFYSLIAITGLFAFGLSPTPHNGSSDLDDTHRESRR